MKKTSVILAAILLLAMLTACTGPTPVGTEPPENTPASNLAPTAAPGPGNYAFEARYIRTNGGAEGVEYPSVIVINSKQELDDYIAANQDKYDLGHRDTAGADGPEGFADVADRYDDAFFEGHQLVMLLLEESSSSNRHEVTNVHWDEKDGWVISLTRSKPEIGTFDMAQWHILVELQTSGLIAEGDAVRLDISNQVTYSSEYASMTLTFPQGWSYNRIEDTGVFGVSFQPEGEPGSVTLSFYDTFGVCGTGLEEHEEKLPGGAKVWVGTYDGDELWDFMRYQNVPGLYIATTEPGAENWWTEDGAGAQILGTAKLGVGSLTETEAIALAEKSCSVKHDTIRPDFDYLTGAWQIRFYSSETAGGDQTVTIGADGSVSSVYGE